MISEENNTRNICNLPQDMKFFTLHINKGLLYLTSARATTSIAMKLRQTWIETYSKTMSLRPLSLSRSFAPLKMHFKFHLILKVLH